MSLVLPSFAKVNWLLKVLGKRRDGYHEVVTVYQTINLCDEIFFELAPKSIRLYIEGRKVSSGQDNLLHRAACLLREAKGIRAGIQIRLRKNIPVCAGLGGGSSNAAMALLAINQLWGCNFRRQDLAKMGAELGSDVPFFLSGGTALGVGRGEKLHHFPDTLGTRHLVLVYPRLEIPTSQAYSVGDRQHWNRSRILTSERMDTTILRFREVLKRKTSLGTNLENDFEGPLLDKYPVLAKTKQILEEAGCKKVMLCGSGSTLMGLNEPFEVDRVMEAVLDSDVGEVFYQQTLSRKRYREILTRSGLHWPEK